MIISYGMYRRVRDASWQTLIDFNIDRLPVDIVKIASDCRISIIKNKELHELRKGEAGISILHGGEWFIIYDDAMNKGRIMFTIAHELGHIFLGHPLKYDHHARTIDVLKPQVETEADMYAARLLAPACVLWGLGIHNAKEIADICMLSKEASQNRAKRMDELYKRNKFLTSPIEKQVYSQFEQFIYNANKEE